MSSFPVIKHVSSANFGRNMTWVLFTLCCWQTLPCPSRSPNSDVKNCPNAKYSSSWLLIKLTIGCSTCSSRILRGAGLESTMRWPGAPVPQSPRVRIWPQRLGSTSDSYVEPTWQSTMSYLCTYVHLYWYFRVYKDPHKCAHSFWNTSLWLAKPDLGELLYRSYWTHIPFNS